MSKNSSDLTYSDHPDFIAVRTIWREGTIEALSAHHQAVAAMLEDQAAPVALRKQFDALCEKFFCQFEAKAKVEEALNYSRRAEWSKTIDGHRDAAVSFNEAAIVTAGMPMISAGHKLSAVLEWLKLVQDYTREDLTIYYKAQGMFVHEAKKIGLSLRHPIEHYENIDIYNAAQLRSVVKNLRDEVTQAQGWIAARHPNDVPAAKTNLLRFGGDVLARSVKALGGRRASRRPEETPNIYNDGGPTKM